MTAAPAATEDSIQRALVRLLHLGTRPGVVWFAVPNGEARNAVTGAKLKGLGVRRGAPDMVFVVPPNGVACGLELKSKRGRVSRDQHVVMNNIRAAGGECEIARSFDEAVAVLRRWGVVR